MNKYLGHPAQIAGAEKVEVLSGKGRGLRLLQVRNGLGLEFSVAEDRCADIYRLEFMGKNFGFFSPCGYVAPQFYDNKGAGFLKSFTAGFLTTCGLTTVGKPCTDNGEELPLHGSIGNTPADVFNADETDDEIIITAKMRDARVFGDKMLLERKIVCSKKENKITLSDKVTNIGTLVSPFMILYHCNMGYPLLSENAEVVIPNTKTRGNDEYAQKFADQALCMEKPQANFQEQCFNFDMKEENGIAKAGIYNKDISRGLVMSYTKDTLDKFNEWKMMGEYDYVLGLEPCNALPIGRDAVRANGELKFLNPGESAKMNIVFEVFDNYEDFKNKI